jgi:hypothetical protein
VASSVQWKDGCASSVVATKPKASLLGLFCVQKRGHNPPLDDVDATDSDKRSEWGERSKQPVKNPSLRTSLDKREHHSERRTPYKRVRFIVFKFYPVFKKACVDSVSKFQRIVH